jgi:hypothetical protein
MSLRSADSWGIIASHPNGYREGYNGREDTQAPPAVQVDPGLRPEAVGFVDL